jgi:hypothetical protein
MKALTLFLAVVALSAGVFAFRSVLPLGAAPGQNESKKFGDLPVQVAQDGSTVPDPNALGIGPEGVIEREPEPRDELIATLANIPSDRKLTLAGGQVIGVVGTCSFPHNYDPNSKCIGLHELSGLSNITVGLQGEVIGQVDRSSASTAVLQRLLDDPRVKDQIVDFLRNAPTN